MINSGVSFFSNFYLRNMLFRRLQEEVGSKTVEIVAFFPIVRIYFFPNVIVQRPWLKNQMLALVIKLIVENSRKTFQTESLRAKKNSKLNLRYKIIIPCFLYFKNSGQTNIGFLGIFVRKILQFQSESVLNLFDIFLKKNKVFISGSNVNP